MTPWRSAKGSVALRAIRQTIIVRNLPKLARSVERGTMTLRLAPQTRMEMPCAMGVPIEETRCCAKAHKSISGKRLSGRQLTSAKRYPGSPDTQDQTSPELRNEGLYRTRRDSFGWLEDSPPA